MADATEMGQAAGELGLTIPVLPSATGMENGKGEKRWGIRGVSRSKGESEARKKRAEDDMASVSSIRIQNKREGEIERERDKQRCSERSIPRISPCAYMWGRMVHQQ
jgi:hypothetical protein